MAWYSGNVYESAVIWNRMTGPYAVAVLGADLLQHRAAPNCCGSSGCARSPVLLFIVSIVRADRHVAGALRDHRHQPAAGLSCRRPGACSSPRAGTGPRTSGTIGLFLFLFFLFIRLLPMISIFEVRTLLPRGARSEEEVQLMKPPILRSDGRVRRRPPRW